MGYLEAVVVVYIRRILGIVPTPEQLDAHIIAQVPDWLLGVERTREAATIIMLVAFAVLVGRGFWQRLAVFAIAFGLWDIFYYVSLKALIDWPASLATTDCLFLIPRPWYGPVWLPIAISCGLVALGVLIVRKVPAAGR